MFNVRLVDTLKQSGERARHYVRDHCAVFTDCEPSCQRFCRVEATQSADDDFGGQEVLLDEATQTLGDALLVLGDDGRVRDRDSARVPEQRNYGIPVRNRTDRTRLGKRTRPLQPRMRRLPGYAHNQQHDHRREQTGRRRAHTPQPNELLVRC